MLIFRSFLLIKHEGIFGFEMSDLIIEPDEVMLKVLEFEEFGFKSSDNIVLMVGVVVIVGDLTSEIFGHFYIEIIVILNFECI